MEWHSPLGSQSSELHCTVPHNIFGLRVFVSIADVYSMRQFSWLSGACTETDKEGKRARERERHTKTKRGRTRKIQ